MDKQESKPLTGIEKAVQMYGSQQRLARAIGPGCTRVLVQKWIGVGYVSARMTPQVHHVTGIPCEELCPQVDWSLVGKGNAETAKAAAERLVPGSV